MRGERFLRSAVYLRRRWAVPLAVCAIFRNEARYLAEWLEFHQRQGVERFYLYENNSTDDWESVLDRFTGVVELRRWADHPGQLSAYADCLRRHRKDTRWVAFIDLDEFLFSPTGRPLPEILRAFAYKPAVAVSWRCYGTSGHREAQDAPVTDSYIYRAPDDHRLHRIVKSIVFPAMTSTLVQNPHWFNVHGRLVDEHGEVVIQGLRPRPTVELLRINHYGTRSLLELQRKLAGPRADSPGSRSVVDPETLLADVDVLNTVHDPLYST